MTLSAAKLTLAVKRAQSQSGSPGLLNSEPIAIIGMGCRLPGGADSPKSYWTLLRNGVDAIRDLPAGRWPSSSIKAAYQGGFLDTVDRFDAEFFGIPPREAERLDPQHRLLMEVLWESLWDARLTPEGMSGSVNGVFVAVYNNDYFRLQFSHPDHMNVYTSTGTSHSTAVGRISFLLDWKGPCVAIDTACSSSLVAVHMACQSLRANECRMAVAGGVSLILAPEELISLHKMGMLAPDSRCKTFDSRADGFVPGEGCGIVLLKRLSDALADGDPIRAVIRGTAVNQDGRSTVLTAPNGIAQQAVIHAALENAHVSGPEISYVEAHGTGTALGDPIEVEALAEALGNGPEPCLLGSVKSNLGHLEAAAGVTGLMKVVLALEQEQIPSTLHFQRLNPHIQLAGTRLVIAERSMPWPRGGAPRFAGVSAFGFGGTNAHAILEEAPIYPGPKRPPVVPHVWKRQRYWFEAPAPAPRENEPALHPLLGRRLSSPVLRETVFECNLSARSPEFLADHRPGGKTILPLAACLEMFLTASGASALEDVIMREALELSPEGTRRTQVVVDGDELRLYSQDQGNWKLHATARRADALHADSPARAESLQPAADKERNVEDFYTQLEARGLHFGPAFQSIRQLWVGDGEASARLRTDDAAENYRIHPILLDGCFQALGALLPDNGLYVPLGLRRFELFRTPGSGELWSRATIRQGSGKAITGDVRVCDLHGQPVAEAQGLWLRMPGAETEERLMKLVWEPRPRLAAGKSSAGGTWLVFADDGGVGASLVEGLEADGERCLVVRRGEDFEKLLKDFSVSRVMHLWSLDAQAPIGSDAENLLREEQEICGSVLRTTQILAAKHDQERPRIVIVTRGAQGAHARQRNCLPAQAPVWGLARTIRREHPDLRCITIDLDPDLPPNGHLLEEIRNPDDEEQVAWRGETRLIPRLSNATDGPECVRLHTGSNGQLEQLRWEAETRSQPGPGEVEIRVATAGLNFRDVLNALGEYPGDAGPLGSECSGWIEQVGEGVTGLAVGDAVVGVARGSFARFVTTRADLIVRKPAELRMDEAAALPVAYVTARYALCAIGKMHADQRVLIHAAAGGVGLAAVAEAQRAGAEIYATAGSEEKRAWLHSLGVRHIMNSRSLDYRREIMEQTAGHGVDLVLNSLAGEHIEESLQTVAPGGIFLELGKRGVWDAQRVANLRPDVRYRVIDWGEEYERDPTLIAGIYREVMDDVQRGVLKPLPCRTFAMDDAEKAFRWMAQGRHIGKIGVRVSSEIGMRREGAYLITGGLGAIGLKVAGWMAARGAGKLVLVGRNEPGDEARAAIRKMKDAGAEVDVHQADISSREELEPILRGIQKAGKPLKGIVHAAGVLDDGVLAQQSWDRMEHVMSPKVLGASHLHALTTAQDLDFFIMFSSLASLLGSPGQGNYAAANAFLDALAHHRRTLGLPGLSINWGPWAGIGMAAQPDATGWQRSFPSLSALGVEQGITLWERALADGNSAQLAAFLSRDNALDLSGPSDSRTHSSVPDAKNGARNASRVFAMRGEKLLRFLQEEAAKIMGLRETGVPDVEEPLFDAGLDSLMAVEFRNVIGAAFGRSFSSTLLFDYPSLRKLAAFLEGEHRPPASGRPEAETEIHDLDEAQAEALLLAELNLGTSRKR